jgi:adenylate cyclase
MNDRAQRRLAAIVSTDVVGYSRLMGVDEADTLARMKAHRRDLWAPEIDRHGGRIVGSAGDSLLIEFASAVSAVECCLAVQQGMAEREAGQSDATRMLLRIGINIGEVVVDGDDIFGDGVNVAARLEALSPAGGICLSGKVHDEIEGKVATVFEDTGPQDVKNIARPVQVWRWPAGDAAVPAPHGGIGAIPTLSDMPPIAVLPFDNMSGDAEQDYFSDGLTEDLITALTHWRTFPVIARNSCFAYKNKATDIKQVARELGAGYVIEGSVRKGGSRVRINAQLIDGLNGHHLWAEKYDRELDDIFELQDEIVQQIAAVVAPELDKAALQQSTGKQPDDLAAWDMCLRGKQLVRGNTPESNANARELFLRAIALRPNYADAYAGLAQSFNQDVITGTAADRAGAATQAMEAAASAVRADDSSSWAHHELSTAYQLLGRLDDALAEGRLAVKLNPYDAYTLHALGNKSDLAGDPGGIGLMEKAQRLNPEDAQRHTHLTFLARAYVAAGQYEAAVERARQAVRRRPDYAPAHYILAVASGHLGRLDEARAALAACDAHSPGFVASRQDWRPYAAAARNEKLAAGRQAASN